jgi:hypothetical protein
MPTPLPARGAGGQQVLRCLQEMLTERREDLVVILAGQTDQLRSLLRARPALASRFPATVDFRGGRWRREQGDPDRLVPGQDGFPLMMAGRPQQDSNLRTRLRRPLLYPLSYGGSPAARRGEPAGPEPGYQSRTCGDTMPIGAH